MRGERCSASDRACPVQARLRWAGEWARQPAQSTATPAEPTRRDLPVRLEPRVCESHRTQRRRAVFDRQAARQGAGRLRADVEAAAAAPARHRAPSEW